MISEQQKAELFNRNQQIIDAIIKKAEKVCPNSLALIGMTGSFSTGDIYEKSDLDLAIVINDPDGWKLGTGFILDEVGFDIYCTTWEHLEKEAEYESTYMTKLMDSKIVYCADEKYKERLTELRKKASAILNAEFSKADYERADEELQNAMKNYASLMLADSITECRYTLSGIIYHLENAVCFLNKTYFKLSVKRIFEELNRMERKPENLVSLIKEAVLADSTEEIKRIATKLMKASDICFKKVKAGLQSPKAVLSANDLRGTYEEMFSNWRNKMYYAAKNKDNYLAFMSMASLQVVFDDLFDEFEMPEYNVMKYYNPNDLWECATSYDKVLEEYREEYEKVKIPVVKYKTIDEFKKAYLGEEADGLN